MNLATTLDRTRERQTGFTLVELLIVVIILGLLAAVVIPQFGDTANATKESSLAANLGGMRQAIALYRVQHNETYPGQSGWDQFVQQMTQPTQQDGTAGGQYGPYVREIPKNAVTGTNTGQVVATMPAAASGTEAYIYEATTGEIRANVAGVAASGTDYFDL